MKSRLFLCGLALAWLGATTPGQEADEPKELGIVERTGRRLGQLDVTVRGPDEVIASLGASDFEIVVGGRFIEEFLVDPLCSPPAPEVRAPVDVVEPPTAPVPPPARQVAAPAVRTTYLFYLDMHHLTMAGRQNALDISRELIDDLLGDGARAMIVSAGKETVTFAQLTDDRGELQAAVDRLEADRDQWDPFPYQEEQRIAEVLKALRDEEDTTRAVGLARRYQREERWRTEKALRLFSIALGRLADLDPPKAVIYFADTMRSRAGRHYLSFFSRRQGEESALAPGTLMAANPFDRAVEEAAAHGIRLYTVEAQGMVADSAGGLGRTNRGNVPQPDASRQRIRDAQDSLVGFALETGGRAFLLGVPAKKIARRIRADLACLYLISFDVRDLPEDRALAVIVRVKRPKVEAQVRGQLVLPSESRRRTTRLLAAFTGMEPDAADARVSGTIIPTGFSDGRYSALVQLAVPASPLPGLQWELGASLVSRGAVRADTAGQISVPGADVPVIYEAVMTFKPGPYELVIVARESTTDQIATSSLEGSWPDPNGEMATVGPFAAMQPARGAFSRDGALSPSGALAVGETGAARAERPTALVGLVCRGRGRKKPLQVERTLIGKTSADFRPMELDLGSERCAQIRDLIPAGTMTPGDFVYEVRVLDGDEELAAARLEFTAVGAEATPDLVQDANGS